MANLSQQKRERMLEFLKQLKSEHTDDASLIALNEIENALISKKYGLVWEQHEEQVDVMMRDNVPVFTEVPEREIKGDPDSEQYNFLLEGDNLHSLKLLEKTHRGRIDVIYIDPPYNRGKNDFVYDDKFVDAEDSFKHSKWLSFMSERLSIAKNLLSTEGVIFISIDDNEQSQLKVLCDEIFDASNCLGVIIQNKQNSKNDTINIQRNHEYILAYRRQCNYISATKVKPSLLNSFVSKKKILVENNEYYYLNDSITTRGEGGTLSKRKNLGYTVYYNPTTGEKLGVMDYDIEKALISDDEDEVYSTRSDLLEQGFVAIRPPRVRGHLGCWTWELKKFNSESHNIAIVKNSREERYSVKKRTFVSQDDVYEEDGKLFYDFYTTANSRSIIEFSTNDGSTELTNILGESGLFDNPKNVEMIKYLIRLVPNKNAIVLDFFAGSGTTAQAVFELNKQDRGKRKVILCTNNQNQICETITYERVKKRIEGYSFDGKKTEIIYRRKIDMNDIYNSDVISEDIRIAEERFNEDEISFDICIEDSEVVFKSLVDGSEKVNGIPANLKYYKTDFIPKVSDKEDYSVTDELLKHIKEMIQLENGINVDGENYLIILTDDDADELEKHPDIVEKCKGIYISNDVFLTSSQEKLFSGVCLKQIPDYYFEDELREVHEIW